MSSDALLNSNNVVLHAPAVAGIRLPKDKIKFCKAGLSLLRSQMMISESSGLSINNQVLDREFEYLERASDEDRYDQNTNIATLRSNLHKNRYPDVLACDHTRVVLKGSSRNSKDGTDYINANTITDQLDQHPMYIATQGPLDSTFVDFWEMVTQNNCSIIIMLTREVEGRVKCGHYFPSEVGKHEDFGNFRVTNTQTLQLTSSIIQRNLLIENPASPVAHVKHFQFVDWPDHGVPSSTSSLRYLIRLLRDSAENSGPSVVHCSAGIGRTGTFCTIDFAIKRVLSGNLSSFSIPNIVKRLRQQRHGMVQTKEQYRFCYSAVRDELQYLIDSNN